MNIEEFLRKKEITAEDVQDLVSSVSQQDILDYAIENLPDRKKDKFSEVFVDFCNSRDTFKLYNLENYPYPTKKDYVALYALSLRFLLSKNEV